MHTTEAQRSLLALCAIKIQSKSIDWSLLAREAQLDGGLDALWNGEFHERSNTADAARTTLRYGVRYRKSLLDWVDKELIAASSVGATLVTVLDESYPYLLRLSPNLPPFLFVCGDITADDARSVAVIGSKDGSPAEIRTAKQLSEKLATGHVTIVSGLEGKTDRAIHLTAIDSGWRTLGVLGAGITTRNAPAIRDLANRVESSGAVVSPFWSTRPQIRNSPRQQVIASELSQGTVFIEPSVKNRTRPLAHIARGHGKKVFILRSLVNKRGRSRGMTQERGALEVEQIDEIFDQLAAPERIRRLSTQRRRMTVGLL